MFWLLFLFLSLSLFLGGIHGPYSDLSVAAQRGNGNGIWFLISGAIVIVQSHPYSHGMLDFGDCMLMMIWVLLLFGSIFRVLLASPSGTDHGQGLSDGGKVNGNDGIASIMFFPGGLNCHDVI